MKFLCEPIKGRDLKPGDIFSAMGDEYWNGSRLRTDPRAIGEKVYLRTDVPAPESAGPDDIVYRISVVSVDPPPPAPPPASRPTRAHPSFVLATLDGTGRIALNGRAYEPPIVCELAGVTFAFGTYDGGTAALCLWGTQRMYEANSPREDDPEYAAAWTEFCALTGERHEETGPRPGVTVTHMDREGDTFVEYRSRGWDWWRDVGPATGAEPQAVCAECRKPATGPDHAECWRERDEEVARENAAQREEDERERYWSRI